MLDRRHFVVLSAWPLLAKAQDTPQLLARVRAGRCVFMLRHARTEPGVGDPPDFMPGQCATQRNLDATGRAQSRAAGDWFRGHGLQPSAVLSSAWCRCIDTAQLAFGRHEPWPPLDSSFGRGNTRDEARPLLQSRLAGIGAGRFEVWVTHQVNISAFTGEATAMGEGLWLDAKGAVLGRSSFA